MILIISKLCLTSFVVYILVSLIKIIRNNYFYDYTTFEQDIKIESILTIIQQICLVILIITCVCEICYLFYFIWTWRF